MPKSDYAQQELLRLTLSPINEDGLLEDELFGDEELLDEDLLDASSLATILDMLTVITSIEELRLLESLTDVQKRQVWRATPEAVRYRLKQIRETNTAISPASPTWENSNPSLGSNQPLLQAGNQIVLMAHPKLTSAELIAIWNVIEVHEDHARIQSTNLGFRTYPVKWMVIYA